MNVIWYTAMSMDGRIADAKESLGFLDMIGQRQEGKPEFPAFLATVDAVIVGASTLRWLLRGGHGWPHDDLPTWLVSHDSNLVAQIGRTRALLRRVDGPLGPVFEEIERAGHKRVSLAGGGSVAGQALAHGGDREVQLVDQSGGEVLVGRVVAPPSLPTVAGP